MAFKLKLYLLELTDDKYYVGQTVDADYRFHEHSKGRGAKWTSLYKPIRILRTKEVTVKDYMEAMLQENRMTLQMMEIFGWENVRGGDFVTVECARIKLLIAHIYDFERNKIRHYLPDCPYLFGASDDWHVYVLQLADGHYYIGSCKHLGKSLGEHFNGKNIAWTQQHRVKKVVELITIQLGAGNYLNVKRELIQKYILRYGWDRVLGG